MDIKDIKKEIEKLENDDTTHENAQKLASLYIVVEHLSKKQIDDTEKELNDILPAYHRYIEIKRKYQLGEISEGLVIQGIKNVCKEIQEFISTLYSCTDMPEERDYILNMIKSLDKIRS